MKRCKKQWSSSPFADYKNFAIHIRAQNNFWMVAGREYLRASGHLLLHTGNTNTRQWNFCSIKTSPLSDRSKIWAGKKVNWTLCNILFVNTITEIKSMIYRLGIGCLFKNESVCDRSTWPASEVPGPSSCLSGRTLSTDQPLFWALHMQF